MELPSLIYWVSNNVQWGYLNRFDWSTAMKLYAVYEDIYEGCDCVGIFDSCDKAEECVIQHWEE